MTTRDRSRMTPRQKQWDTIARGNYRPPDRSLSVEQRRARSLASLLRHVRLYFGPDGARNYEELTGHAGARSVAVLLDDMIARLDKTGKGEQ